MKEKDYDYCKNCKNFHQHYVNIKNVGIRAVACGHCMGHKMQFGCKSFEQKQIENRDVDLLNLLLKIESNTNIFIAMLNEFKNKIGK